jgi:hypothetical protein
MATNPKGLGPEKGYLARASSIFKRQTHPLVREGAQQKQDRNWQTITNIWSWAPDGARHQDLLIDRPSVAMWLLLWLDFEYRIYPCGGGVEYLHRDPASRRRRRKGKSQIWDCKIWSRIPRNSDPRKATWRGPAAYSKDRLVLLSERAPHKSKTVTVKE